MNRGIRQIRSAVIVLLVGSPLAFGQESNESSGPTRPQPQGLSTRELVRYATELADELRSSALVTNSSGGIQVASPVYTSQLSARLGSEQTLGRLLNEINMRCGAKIQFIRRDSKDPQRLPHSTRFDYESRILLTDDYSAAEPTDRRTTLVIEFYEPAGESPILSKGILLGETGSPSEESSAKKTSTESQRRAQKMRSVEQSKNGSRDSGAVLKEASPSRDESVRQRDADESRVREVSFGRIEFKDRKVARRLAILSEASKTLDDGRIHVQITLVCKKKSQDVEIRATFFDGHGKRLSKSDKKDYKLEEGRPRTVVFRSRQPAARFVMRIDKD